MQAHKDWEQAEGFQWSAWQAEKLRNIEIFRKENVSIMNGYSNVIEDETYRLMKEQFQEGEKLVDDQLSELKDRLPESDETSLVKPDHFFGVNERKMQALMNDITTIEKTAETSALRMTDDIYRQTVNRVQLAMATGSMTLNQAIDIATKDFLSHGINSIVYSDGKRVNIADYVRMALRTTSTRATLQGRAKRFSELGYDTVMTSQYGGCSKTCEPWQGKVYIDDVFTHWQGEKDGDYGISNYCGKRFMLLSAAIRGGLFHPNCRHTLLQYIDGITKIPDPIPADKIQKQRELEEKQRAMERKIRKLKRFEAGTLDTEMAKEYRRKLRQAQHELKVFVDENNDVLRRDYSREKVYGAATKGVAKNVQIQGGFSDTKVISEDIKSEIINSIEELQSQYNVKVDEFLLEDISEEYGKVAFQFRPINDNGSFKSIFIVNKGFNWDENLDKLNERIYNRNYKRGILASKNTKDLIAHEMAHFMSFQDCKSYADFLWRERELRAKFISGVSAYSDNLEDGAETIAEGFVRIRNGDAVDERVKTLVDGYVERWRK